MLRKTYCPKIFVYFEHVKKFKTFKILKHRHEGLKILFFPNLKISFVQDRSSWSREKIRDRSKIDDCSFSS